jgi:hypothetical protein
LLGYLLRQRRRGMSYKSFLNVLIIFMTVIKESHLFSITAFRTQTAL